MSVKRSETDPNFNLYEQLRRDVLQRLPQVVTVTYEPDAIEAKKLKAIFDSDRITPPTGPDSPELTVEWYRQTPDDWFRINYSDPNTGFHVGWHQDEDHSDLGTAHIQYATSTTSDRWGVTFANDIPSLVLWEIVELLLDEMIPKYAP
jgi:hypothetical protein